jgi:ribose transport system permease protein
MDKNIINNRKNMKLSFEHLRQMILVLIFVLICIILSIMTPNFLTFNNIRNIVRQVSYTAIASIGMTLVIILGQIDLSAGSLIAISGLAAAYTFKLTNSPVMTFIGAIIIGSCVGLFNGILTAKGKIPGFIATLASMTILRGLAYIVTNGSPIAVLDTSFTFFGIGFIWVIPIPVIFMLIAILIGTFLTNRTRFGRYVYAVGGNEETAKWSGINVAKIKILVYLVLGVFTSISGLIVAGRLGSGQPSAGLNFEMDCITAAVVGGTSMSGGKGKLSGTIVGVLLLGVLTNGMTLLDINTYWQQVIKGIIIVVAVLIDTTTKKTS